jgi:hypothetical protein
MTTPATAEPPTAEPLTGPAGAPDNQAAALAAALGSAEASMREFADALLSGGGRRNLRLGTELLRRAGFARQALEAARQR